MSQNAIPTAVDCCSPCVPQGTSSTPGPRGPAGADGAAGSNGVNATAQAASFTMPADSGTVAVTLTTGVTTWMFVGEIVQAGAGGTQGFFRVTTITDATHVTLQNLYDGFSAYTTNAAPGTVFPNQTVISPAGPQGPQGLSPDTTGFLQSANNLNDVASAATSRGNLGLGTAALLDAGVGLGSLAPVNNPFTNGNIVFATGTGMNTKAPPDTRDWLNLKRTIGAGDIAPNDGALTANWPVFGTANGHATVAPATARSLLGVAGNDMLLFRQQAASGDAGDFTSGGFNTVPLNAKVVDTGSNGSISGSQITLTAGTYRYQFNVCAYGVSRFQGSLYNVTDSAVIVDSYGSIGESLTATPTNAFAPGEGRFTLAASKVIALRAQCLTSKVASGFGKSAGFGLEVYSWLQLWKE